MGGLLDASFYIGESGRKSKIGRQRGADVFGGKVVDIRPSSIYKTLPPPTVMGSGFTGFGVKGLRGYGVTGFQG